MRAGFESYFLAMSLAIVPLASAAADTITVDFENATGLDSLLGVENPNTPSAKNVGFEDFYWAWNGSGAINPGNPALTGFLLGNKKSNPDFSYVGGSDPQFVYLTLSQRLTDAYITTKEQSFDFLGAVFSSRTPGTLIIVGQEKSANGIGGGTFSDVQGATTKVAFDGITEVVTLETTDFRDIDRLVISLSDTNGKTGPLQWVLNDFTYAPVPEPGTWAMFGLGVLAVGFAVKRRKPRIR